MYGSGCCLSPSARCKDFSLHRRLASGVTFQKKGSSGHKLHHTHITKFRSHHKLGQVHANSFSSDVVHRSYSGLKKGKAFSAYRPHTKASNSPTGIPTPCPSVSTSGRTSARPHGIDNGCFASRQAQNEITTGMAPSSLQSVVRPPKEAVESHPRVGKTTVMVGLPATSSHGAPFSTPTTVGSGYNGCEPHGLGGSLQWPHRECLVDLSSKGPPHKPSRADSSNKGLQGLSPHNTGSWCASCNRQYHDPVLYKQAGRNKVSVLTLPSCTALGMVLCPSCVSHGHSHSDNRELSSRHSKPSKKSVPRVGTKPTHVSGVVPQMGPSSHRHVCFERKQKMSRLCLKSREGSLIPGGRLHDSLEETSHLPVPADSSNSKDHSQANSTQGLSHPGGPLLATSAVVPSPPRGSHGRLQVSDDARLALQRLRVHSPPGRGIPSPDRLEDLPEIKEILDKSRKPSTKSLYKYKWDNFVRFALSKDLQTSPVSLRTLLIYLRHLFDLGLSVSTLKVYAAAIVVHQPSGSSSAQLFTHPTVKTFFKGLMNARPPVRAPIPQWSLTLVLNALMKHPFEPMSSCDLKFLSLKTLFLVAITSARRASELAALRSDSPYLQFYKDKVVLFPDISFLPKVVSEFHLNQPISLPTLFSDPSSDIERMLHSLDVKRALSYYISRTRDFRASHKLFLCYYGSRKGSAASAPALSRWLVSTVVLAYQLSKKDVPEGIRGHSTRSMATSTALLRGVDLPDICRAATWSKVSTFVTHYRLDLRAKKETSFGRAVLTSVLQ
ncbi:uncharacterized protein LOC140704554 [Pogona vitticeps]